MKITAKAVLSHLSTGEAPRYRLVPTNPTKFTEEDFVALIAAKSGQGMETSRYWLDLIGSCLFERLSANCSMDLGFASAKLYVGGTIGALGEQPTKEGNPVRGRIFFKGRFTELFRTIEVVNDTETVAAVLYEVMQDEASDVNRIEAAGKRIVMNGSLIRLDPNQADDGVWLEDLKTGVKIADATVAYSDASTCHCSFETLPRTGQYRIVLATRNAEDPERFAIVKLTRKVQVVNNEEVTHE